MNYMPNLQDRKYNKGSGSACSVPVIFQKMYDDAVKFALSSGSHIGDYSKEILEKPSKNYEHKMPVKRIDENSNYKFFRGFSVN